MSLIDIYLQSTLKNISDLKNELSEVFDHPTSKFPNYSKIFQQNVENSFAFIDAKLELELQTTKAEIEYLQHKHETDRELYKIHVENQINENYNEFYYDPRIQQLEKFEQSIQFQNMNPLCQQMMINTNKNYCQTILNIINFEASQQTIWMNFKVFEFEDSQKHMNNLNNIHEQFIQKLIEFSSIGSDEYHIPQNINDFLKMEIIHEPVVIEPEIGPENIELKLSLQLPHYRLPDRIFSGPGGVLPILSSKITNQITIMQHAVRNKYIRTIHNHQLTSSQKIVLGKYCEQSDFIWCFDEPEQMVKQDLITNEQIDKIYNNFSPKFHSGEEPIRIPKERTIFTNRMLQSRISTVKCSTRMKEIWSIIHNISFIFPEFQYGCGLELLSPLSVNYDYTHNNLSIFGGGRSNLLSQYETVFKELLEEGHIVFSESILSLQYQVDIRRKYGFEPFDNTVAKFLPISVSHGDDKIQFRTMVIFSDSTNCKLLKNEYGFPYIYIDV